MDRIALFTATILLASTFVLMAPASADDVNECLEGGDAEVCLYDSTEGDADEACDEEGSGTYEAKSGVEGQTAEETPYASFAAGGEEECDHGYWSYSETQEINSEVEVCLEGGTYLCTAGVEAAFVWDEEGIDAYAAEGVDVNTPAGTVSAQAQWSETYSGDNQTDVSVGYCGPGGFFVCEPDAGAGLDWDEDEFEADAGVCVVTAFFYCSTGSEVFVFWGEDWNTDGCEQQVGAWYGVAELGQSDEQAISEDCAAEPPAPPGAPGSPNPGWGQLTPDTGGD